MKKLLAVCLLLTTSLSFAQTQKIIECADDDVKATLLKKDGVLRLQYFRNFPSGWIKMDDTKVEVVRGKMFMGASTRLIIHPMDGKFVGELLTSDETCNQFCIIRDCTDYSYSSR